MTETPFNFDEAVKQAMAAGGTTKEISARLADAIMPQVEAAREAGRIRGDNAAAFIVADCETREQFFMRALNAVVMDMAEHLTDNDFDSWADRRQILKWVPYALKLMRAGIESYGPDGRRIFHA